MRRAWLLLPILVLGCGETKKHPMPAPTVSASVATAAPSSSAPPPSVDRDWAAISVERKGDEWPKAGRYERELEHAGSKRRYLFQIPPAKKKDKKAPLLIFLHGDGGKPEQFMREGLGITLMAARNGWLAVFPQGSVKDPDKDGYSWSHGLCSEGADDVAFITALIEQVSKDIEVDARRIYVMGFASGGQLTQVLGVELGPRLAGIVPIASYPICTPQGGQEQRIAPKTPMNVLMLFGEKDPRVPVKGGPTEDGKLTIGSVEDVIGIWTAVNKCGEEAERRGSPTDPAHTIDFDCPETKKHVLTVINRKVGHQIPEKLGRRPTMELVGRFLEASFLPREDGE